MGTKDRRQRELAEREQRFLDAAQALIQRDGLLALQMSRVAEECDYATGTLYQHFASKEDLLVALATRNCLARVDLFERAARWDGPTRERMLAVAIADLMVLESHPETFRLAQFVWTDVVWGAASPAARERSLQATEPLGRAVDGIVVEARRRGDLPDDVALSPSALTIGPWSLMLGLHTLVHAEGVLPPAQFPRPYRLMFRHLQHLLDGYGWRPLFDPRDDRTLEETIQRVSLDVFDLPCPGLGRTAFHDASPVPDIPA